MTFNHNSFPILKEDLLALIKHISKDVSLHIHQGKIDSQAIFSLTKLIDTLLKIEIISPASKRQEITGEGLRKDDQGLLNLYEREVLAPRAGLEPATKRLTAACSTTELPRN